MPDAAAPLDAFLADLQAALADGGFVRVVLAKPRVAGVDLLKVSGRALRLKGRPVVSFVETHRTRDVTRNLAPEEAADAVRGWLSESFAHGHLLAHGGETEWRVGKRGREMLRRGRAATRTAAPAGVKLPIAGAAAANTTAKAGETNPTADATAPTESAAARPVTATPTASLPAGHDRVKVRPVDLGRPFLIALGVTDAEHRLIPAMARKWKQINKFVEVLDGAIASAGLRHKADGLHVLDFGSGKGYLTFAIHDHLRHTLGLAATVTGVELRRDLVDLCNAAARTVGAEGLVFEEGDVGHRAPAPVDLMIALHACDTATDHAIHAGIRAGAAVIVCSPCCHKELRPQLLSPHPLSPVLRHGVHLGQQAEMLTDGLRAMLLDACGYDAQVFEFVALEHTSKNKMILAVRRPGPLRPADRVWEQIDALKRFYGIRTQALETLLRADGRVPATAEALPA